ncbi:WD40-repeat-containing domain protein [Emericellopsis atlantica]|uniref:WD40-repeat-containing domain protein n=1 Tax=Emericellopsis atlantica TaxID=2614577 RepID=A0A9P7ZQZ4_9HYPO|nr:WD40-repeat-containing domain protein [Emericellopsis atlantica]KAG9256688.1 WD40-repeat-containing domain protein [Emericellopsis atlantica]
MDPGNEILLRETPLTKVLCEEHAIITSLHIGDGFLLVASAKGCLYKVDLAVESVEVLAEVNSVWSLACQEETVIFGTSRGEIHVLDMNTRAPSHTIQGHESLVRCLTILDRSTVVSGSRDGTIRIWTLESGQLQPKPVLRGHTAEVRNIQTCGEKIVSASYDTDTRIWSAQTGECLQVLHGHQGRIHGLAYDGKRVATSSTDGDIRIWDPETGTCRAIFKGDGHNASYVSLLRLAGDALLSGSADGSVKSWALDPVDDSPRELSRADQNGGAVTSMQVQGRHAIVGTSSGVVKVIDCDSVETLHCWKDGACGLAVFRVGFTREHSPVAAYLKEESVCLTLF